jgi:hypothetical protein
VFLYISKLMHDPEDDEEEETEEGDTMPWNV